MKSRGNIVVRETVFLMAVFASLFIITVMTTGCAKKKNDINNVSTDAYIRKSDLTGCQPGQDEAGCRKIYSYVEAIQSANEELDDRGVIPGFHMDFGYIQFVITENELQVRRVGEPNRDPSRATVVASFSISAHFDIKRETNDFGEPTNKIVEDTKRPWDQRDYMRVDFSKNSVKSASLDNVFGTQLATEDVKITTPLAHDGKLWTFDTDASVTQKETILSELFGGDFSDSSEYRAHLKSSFLEVSPSDYRPYEMSNNDFARFGYFRTYENFINPDIGLSVSGALRFANRFNVCESNANTAALSCSKNKIVYTMNQDMPDEFKQGARDVIANWNDTFKRALDRTDDVVILDETVQPPVGDVRYNMIAGINEKLPTGLLGVSQTVTSPITGETISARASVYLGTVYLLGGLAAEQFDMITQGSNGTGTDVPSDPQTIFKSMQSNLKSMGLSKFNSGVSLSRPTKQTIQAIADVATEPATNSLTRMQNVMKASSHWIGVADAAFNPAFAQLPSSAADPMGALVEATKSLFQAKDFMSERIKEMSRSEKGIHMAESVEPAVELYVRQFIAAHQGEPLAQIREQLKTEVRQLVFKTTLVHEMGHNFGLRHNFAASSDRKNYTDRYWELEKQKQGLPPGDPQAQIISLKQQSFDYSSVMDYMGGLVEVKGGTGPYDLAAIRFAYNTSIDKNADPITGLVHDYKFCTDHQVGEDLLCQRFDKGSNVAMATQHAIEDFQRRYVFRNFRRDRVNFGSFMSHFRSILINIMWPIRQVSDEFVYQLITSPQVAAGPNDCPESFIKDSVDAGEMANICDPAVLKKYQAAGVNLSDWSQLVAFLFTDDLSSLRKSATDYRPNGFADLIYSNALASKFFADVVGAGEPGLYFPNQADDGSVVLDPLPDGSDDDSRLKAYLTSKGLSDQEAAAMVPTLKPQLVDLQPGPNAKYLESIVKSDGAFKRVEVMGFIYDKLAAMVMMGLRGLPIEKYEEKSLNLNMYFAPQTQAMVSGLFKALITDSKNISTIQARTRGGQLISAIIPSSTDLTTKSLGAVFAIGDLISDTAHGFADKIRICSQFDADRCQSKFGLPVAMFTSKSGQNTYHAVQLLSGDSIGYDMVLKAQPLSLERDQAAADKQNHVQLIADTKKAAADPAIAKRESDLMTLLKTKAPELLGVLAGVFSPDAGSDGPTLWKRIMSDASAPEMADSGVALRVRDVLKSLSGEVASLLQSKLAAKPDVLKEISDATKGVLDDMVKVNGLTVRAIASDDIINQDGDQIQRIEDDVLLIRDILNANQIQ